MFSAAVCLAAYLLGNAVVADVAVIATALDGRHDLLLRVDNGRLHVTLRHDVSTGADQTRQVSHQHSATCAMVYRFWGTPGAGSDHRLQFVLSGISEIAGQGTKCAALPADLHLELPATAEDFERVAAARALRDYRAPPVSLLATAVTVLLI